MEWTPVWDAPRPYCHPVRTPAGATLSVEAPADHPWHHGLWFAIKYVNGENYWEEYGEFGLLRAEAVEQDDATTTATVRWERPGSDEVVLHERKTLTHLPLDEASYVIDWVEELVPRVDVVLDRTPFTTWGGYGGLTLRGAPDWHDTALVLPDGAERDHVLGEPAEWCTLQGDAPVPGGGDQPCGVAIFDHPSNVRPPTPWYGHNRWASYGDGWSNMLDAAFLWHEPLPVAAGDRLTLRHRVVVHDGRWSVDRTATAYADWTAG